MSLASTAKAIEVDAVTFAKKLLAELEGSPQVKAAEVAVVETIKSSLEAAIAPYLGALSALVDTELNALATKAEAVITGSAQPTSVPPAVAPPNPT